MLTEQDQVGDLTSDNALQETRQDAPGPQGTMAGRVYVSQNPLEQVGALMKQYAAKKKVNANDATIKALRTQITGGRAIGIGAIAGLGGAAPPSPYDANGMRLPVAPQQT